MQKTYSNLSITGQKLNNDKYNVVYETVILVI